MIRVTPLNMVLAAMLVYILYARTGLFGQIAENRQLVSVWGGLAIALLFFIADLIFRHYIKSTKRIWIVQLIFIIFVAVLTVIISRI